ncbi:hypothetical protein MKW98_016659 [Papaver atlanticum]|uniref:Cytochrome P450 n=1 Tax=Papaver atlanticum TaxID=357466 RepID=A0AAD4XI13_9MAGN|nr:hypothetical protein MKW98_016659 [Papaver atlanticum]
MNFSHLFQFSTSSSLICLFILLLSYLLLLWSWSCKKTSSKPAQAPVPAGAWPIIGHLRLLRGKNPPYVTLGGLADKYGPAITIRIGLKQALVVSSWEIAKECFTTNDEFFSSRPSSAGAKNMCYDQTMFGLAPYGPYWRKLRKVVNHELSFIKLQLVQHIWDSEINKSIKELHELYLNSKNNKSESGDSGVLVDMKRWFANLSLNIYVKTVVGNESAVPSSDDEWIYPKPVREFIRLMGVSVLSDALPFLKGWSDIGGYKKEMKKNGKALDVMTEKWLQEHKRKNKSSPIPGDEQDFMDVMMSILLGDKNNTGKLSKPYVDDDTITKSSSLALILGANDATVTNLVWAVSLLLNDQSKLKRFQDELDNHVGDERQVQQSDIKDLPYLQAIMKETLRLYAAPLLPPRESTGDCIVAGYFVPAGTRLIINSRKIHRDPRVWSNPSEFQPERFLTGGNQVDVDIRGQNFELIPCGAGRRMCPGVSLAAQVVHLALARLVHGFNLKVPSSAPIDMTESVGFTNIKATPLELILNPRLSSDLYSYN